jgi:hypothetical protein
LSYTPARSFRRFPANHGRAMVVALLLVSILSGCVSTEAESEPGFFEMTFLEVRDGYSMGNGDNYWGSIVPKRCVMNMGDSPAHLRFGEDYFIVRPGFPEKELELVESRVELGRSWSPPGDGWFIRTAEHKVFLNETRERGSLDYAVRVWHEQVDVDPPVYEEHWVNLTFNPLIDEVYERQGEHCVFRNR